MKINLLETIVEVKVPGHEESFVKIEYYETKKFWKQKYTGTLNVQILFDDGFVGGYNKTLEQKFHITSTKLNIWGDEFEDKLSNYVQNINRTLRTATQKELTSEQIEQLEDEIIDQVSVATNMFNLRTKYQQRKIEKEKKKEEKEKQDRKNKVVNQATEYEREDRYLLSVEASRDLDYNILKNRIGSEVASRFNGENILSKKPLLTSVYNNNIKWVNFVRTQFGTGILNKLENLERDLSDAYKEVLDRFSELSANAEIDIELYEQAMQESLDLEDWLTLFEREKEVYVDVLKRMYAIFERKNPEPEKIIPELERMLQFQGGNIAAIKPDVSEYKLPDVLKLEEDLDSVIERVVDDFEKYIKGVEQDIVVKCQQNNKKKGSWVIRTNCPKEEKHFRTGSCGKITRHTSYDQPVIFENVTGIPIKLPQEKTVYDQQLSSALRISEEYGDARIAAENIVRLCAQKATEKVKDQNLANTQGTIKKFHPYLFEECLHAERMCDLLKLRMCKIYKADPKEYGVSETMLPKPIRRDRENKTDKNKTDENKVDDKTEKMVKDDGKLKQ